MSIKEVNTIGMYIADLPDRWIRVEKKTEVAVDTAAGSYGLFGVVALDSPARGTCRQNRAYFQGIHLQNLSHTVTNHYDHQVPLTKTVTVKTVTPNSSPVNSPRSRNSPRISITNTHRSSIASPSLSIRTVTPPSDHRVPILNTPRPSIPSISTRSPSIIRTAAWLDNNHVPLYAPSRPEELRSPRVGQAVKGFYVISKGQEVGIFYNWNDVSERVTSVSGARQEVFPSFEDTLEAYTDMYNRGSVVVAPIRGSHFDTLRHNPPSPTDALWDEVGDIDESLISSFDNLSV
ncbi:hypothetical protein BJ138DRAFT_1118903 [Hygrophoropsis aurantiaca]|uniref:Uncharacterized protein n=1 Tax=Hygrophoropsis aurantiaca TaxID=72124 RepID=A0ACB7ZW27_9AGAM|nr:hypothetical protein BJ138DRAFT_1118903 [Hygrophoropsis aurantiaca]